MPYTCLKNMVAVKMWAHRHVAVVLAKHAFIQSMHALCFVVYNLKQKFMKRVIGVVIPRYSTAVICMSGCVENVTVCASLVFSTCLLQRVSTVLH